MHKQDMAMLEKTYPEYYDITTNTIQKINKAILIKKNEPLVNAISKYYDKNIPFTNIPTFLIENKDNLTEELRKNRLILKEKSGNSINIIDCNDNTLEFPCSLRTLAAASYISSKLDNSDVQQATQNVVSK